MLWCSGLCVVFGYGFVRGFRLRVCALVYLPLFFCVSELHINGR